MVRLQDLYRGEKAERERRNDFFCYLVYRPISFLVTPIFLRLGMSASTVTLLGGVVASSMPLVAWLSPGDAYLWIAISSMCWNLLDCVDGNVARAMSSTSGLGQYVDTMAGRGHHLLLNVSIAIVAAVEVPAIDPGYWMCLPLLGSLAIIWGRECRASYKLDHVVEPMAFSADRPFGWRNVAAASPSLAPFGLLVLGPIDMAYLVLCCLLVMDLAVFLYTQAQILARLAR